MKRNWLFLTLCLLSLNANALIVSVDGYEDISEAGLEIVINEATVDPLSGKSQMKLEGSLLCTTPLTVTISRSATGLDDEFCCGQCQTGNEEKTQVLDFTPGGVSSWYIHYTPAPNSHETIVYTFDDGKETRTLTVHFNNDAEGIEANNEELKVKARKVLRDGIVYIEYNNHIYPL